MTPKEATVEALAKHEALLVNEMTDYERKEVVANAVSVAKSKALRRAVQEVMAQAIVSMVSKDKLQDFANGMAYAAGLIDQKISGWAIECQSEKSNDRPPERIPTSPFELKI